jgi:hypothetical protein
MERLLESKRPQNPVSFHPGGKILAFIEEVAPGNWDIGVLPIDGNEAVGWKVGPPSRSSRARSRGLDAELLRQGALRGATRQLIAPTEPCGAAICSEAAGSETDGGGSWDVLAAAWGRWRGCGPWRNRNGQMRFLTTVGWSGHLATCRNQTSHAGTRLDEHDGQKGWTCDTSFGGSQFPSASS